VGVPAFQDARHKLWAILPFVQGMKAGTGRAAPRKQIAWMEALVPCFSSSTTMGNESEPRSISQFIDYRREAEEAVGL
jgi:hypothetical protein